MKDLLGKGFAGPLGSRKVNFSISLYLNGSDFSRTLCCIHLEQLIIIFRRVRFCLMLGNLRVFFQSNDHLLILVITYLYNCVKTRLKTFAFFYKNWDKSFQKVSHKEEKYKKDLKIVDFLQFLNNIKWWVFIRKSAHKFCLNNARK